jgi:hypothetical protein
MEILSNTMANTLWNLNNKLGHPEDYYGLIWNGLSKGAGIDLNAKEFKRWIFLVIILII